MKLRKNLTLTEPDGSQPFFIVIEEEDLGRRLQVNEKMIADMYWYFRVLKNNNQLTPLSDELRKEIITVYLRREVPEHAETEEVPKLNELEFEEELKRI
jgi:hypothetical protein